MVFSRKGCKVIDEDGTCVATGSRLNGLFKLEQIKPKVFVCQRRRRRRRRRREATNEPRCTVVKLDFEPGAIEGDEAFDESSDEDPDDSVTFPALPLRNPCEAEYVALSVTKSGPRRTCGSPSSAITKALSPFRGMALKRSEVDVTCVFDEMQVADGLARSFQKVDQHRAAVDLRDRRLRRSDEDRSNPRSN